jgi:hypothetical protein
LPQSWRAGEFSDHTDVEAYWRDLFRVLAHWPRERYLELAPKYWARTRARLDPVELAAEIGPLTVPVRADRFVRGNLRAIKRASQLGGELVIVMEPAEDRSSYHSADLALVSPASRGKIRWLRQTRAGPAADGAA